MTGKLLHSPFGLRFQCLVCAKRGPYHRTTVCFGGVERTKCGTAKFGTTQLCPMVRWCFKIRRHFPKVPFMVHVCGATVWEVCTKINFPAPDFPICQGPAHRMSATTRVEPLLHQNPYS